MIWVTSGLRFLLPAPSHTGLPCWLASLSQRTKGECSTVAKATSSLQEPGNCCPLHQDLALSGAPCCLHEHLNSNPQEEVLEHGLPACMAEVPSSVCHISAKHCVPHTVWGSQGFMRIRFYVCGPHTCVVGKTHSRELGLVSE